MLIVGAKSVDNWCVVVAVKVFKRNITDNCVDFQLK